MKKQFAALAIAEPVPVQTQTEPAAPQAAPVETNESFCARICDPNDPSIIYSESDEPFIVR